MGMDAIMLAVLHPHSLLARVGLVICSLVLGAASIIRADAFRCNCSSQAPPLI